MVRISRKAAVLKHRTPFSHIESEASAPVIEKTLPQLPGPRVYPEFMPYLDFPLITRMLLYGDGSTTVSLQQITGSRIVADVLPSFAAGANVHPRFSDVFASTDPHDLCIRHTILRDESGSVVSENLITYRAADEDTLIPPAGAPFGMHTRRLGLYERRRLFDSGVTRDSFGLLPRASVGRCYEIAFSSLQRVLVHEVFNPDLLAPWSRGDRCQRSDEYAEGQS